MKNTVMKERETREFELKLKNRENLTKYRLQAYERLALFLERISPNSLVLRIPPTGKTVYQYQRELLIMLRQELDHNVSQQVYVSSELWGHIRLSKERMSMLISQSASELSPEMPAEALRNEIFENYSDLEDDQPIEMTLEVLKREVSRYF
ncbi:hypothetical protein K5X82_05450 [Halosquirtibacter xylanolyticus]|uniref:DUF7935 family protein n=1 Tax=Halosquirtibacter xylanolyticus TaxID=3374599 RepID=UPI00374877D4|nr:hypothetical protein K5X82_05450 [Prolixibacteraceae bacterium]